LKFKPHDHSPWTRFYELDNIDRQGLSDNKIYLYNILITLFLLAYEPKYSYLDILNIIDYKNFEFPIWKKYAVRLVGAFLGFNEILKQNMEISDDLIRSSAKVNLINILP
jgi:hypothetical protein